MEEEEDGKSDVGGGGGGARETLCSDIVRTPRRRRADGESHIIRVIIGRK